MITHKTMTSAAAILGLLAAGVSPSDAQTNAPVLIAQAKQNGLAAAAKAARKLAQEERVMPADAAPFEDGAALVLNLKPLFKLTFATLPAGHERYTAFLGRQVIDGVPLHIEGNVTLYGRLLAERGSGAQRLNPRVIRGVRVGRAFEELHLAHEGGWGDVEGNPIAIVTLRYRDGTTADLPIVFGAHVRGGGRGPSEEKETLTDPDSKIIWRGPGPGWEEFRIESRIFKSMLRNPHPDKVVETLDLKSAGEPLASYTLIAATVTPGDPNRPVTPPMPTEAPRNFDGRLVVHVIDAATRRPVSNATIVPALNIDGVYLVGSPLLTSEGGEATLPYPTTSTTEISLSVKKGSSSSGSAKWQPGVTNITVELPPSPTIK
jgi:hypothetical protein